MKDEELRDLVEKSLNETATDAESRALEARLLEDRRARAYYLNEVNLHASLRRRFSAKEESPVVVAQPKTSWTILLVGMVAALVLVAGLMIFLKAPSQPTAVIAHAVGAYGEGGAAFAPGESVEAGKLDINKGLMRLDFSNGAKVTVEGPAQLEVIDAMRLILHRGVVTATIPESAIGFVVDTSAAHVVDLGTSFGVSVNEDGVTDVCVFDGEVEVSSGEVAPRLLQEGQSVRASDGSEQIDSIAYETGVFENAWPINSDVLQTTGSIRFVSPGPDFHPGNYEDNEHIVVFPERRELTGKTEIRVDMIDPGEYAKVDYNAKPILLSDQRLTSFLLQLNAYPEGKNPNRRRSVQGQITFANPIVGVITEDRLLTESEAIFGIPDVDYPSARTVEPRPAGDERPGFDRIVLAADRRTLFIDLQENPGHLDQVRVLVESN